MEGMPCNLKPCCLVLLHIMLRHYTHMIMLRHYTHMIMLRHYTHMIKLASWKARCVTVRTRDVLVDH
jgi:hypothetical protein